MNKLYKYRWMADCQVPPVDNADLSSEKVIVAVFIQHKL